MRLLDWWNKEQNQEQQQQVAGGIFQDRIKGLDIAEAVNAHQAWKERLFKYVHGSSTEKLDNITICRDNACALGKWIYSEGQTFFSEVPDYHKLKSAHAAFHIAAGDIVQAVNAGYREKAEKLLVEGHFSEHSREVQLMLAKLYTKIHNEE